jgi:hypothetical protein
VAVVNVVDDLVGRPGEVRVREATEAAHPSLEPGFKERAEGDGGAVEDQPRPSDRDEECAPAQFGAGGRREWRVSGI